MDSTPLTPSARFILAAAILITLMAGVALVLVSDLHTLAVVMAAVLRSSWGAIMALRA